MEGKFREEELHDENERLTKELFAMKEKMAKAESAHQEEAESLHAENRRAREEAQRLRLELQAKEEELVQKEEAHHKERRDLQARYHKEASEKEAELQRALQELRSANE